MNTIQIAMIIFWTTIGTLLVTYLISRVVTRIKKKIKHYNTLWSTLNNLKQDYKDLNTDLVKLEDEDLNNRLAGVEKVANNFDRDMNKYNYSITRDNVAFTSKYNEVIAKFKKGLGAAFQRISKLEGKGSPGDDVFKHFVDDKFRMIEGKLNKLDKNIDADRGTAREDNNELEDVYIKEIKKLTARLIKLEKK